MANRLRLGKAYEHTILGMLTLEGFDVYQPVVDDQGIDGVIRVPMLDGTQVKYYELQVKGSKSWSGIRCKAGKLNRQVVLILYCADARELLWFLYEELGSYFPPLNPEWGDVFLNQESVDRFKSEGRDQLSELVKRL